MIACLVRYLLNFSTVGITCITLSIVYYYFSTSKYDKFKKLNIPHVRPLPLFVSTFKSAFAPEHFKDSIDRIYNRFPNEKWCGFYQTNIPVLMIRDPELINSILVKDFTHFVDHSSEADDPSVNLLKSGLFFMKGQRWRTMRHKLSPGFTSGKLRLAHCQISECSKQLMNYIDEKSKNTDLIEVHDVMAKYAIDVIGTCAFGLKLDTIKHDNSDFRKYGEKIFQPSGKLTFSRFLIATFPTISKMLKLKEFSQEASAFYSSVFSEVIKYRETNNVNRNDVTQTLMQARKELVLNHDAVFGEKFTEMDIVGNAINMFIAGTEPVSTTLAFCLHELAMNAHIQDKLRQHILVTKQKHADFNYDYLMDLHYADMVITETLRKCNGVVILYREATKRYQVPNESLVIEKGQQIIIPIYSIHHDPKYYSNPNVFDPENFSPEEKMKRPRATELSFGDGPRFCIGKRFSYMEIKLALSEILSKYEVLPCEKTENSVNIRKRVKLIVPNNGIWLKLRPISTK